MLLLIILLLLIFGFGGGIGEIAIGDQEVVLGLDLALFW